jgi:O-antigen ligase
MLIYYFLIFVLPLEYHRIWGHAYGNITVIKYVGAASILYAAVHFFQRERVPSFFAARSARWFFVFMAMAIIEFVRVGNFWFLSQSRLFNCISFMLFFFVTITVVDSHSRLRGVLLAAVGSVAFASLYAIRDWQKYRGIYEGYRPSGPTGDPNYFALTAMFTIALGTYLAIQRAGKLQTYFCLGSVFVTTVAVTLGGSRGAFLGMAAMFLMVVLRSNRRMLYLSVAGTVFLFPSLFLANSPLRRFFAPSERDMINVEERTLAWKAGLRMVRDNPLTGVGVGAFKPLMKYYQLPGEKEILHIAHNTYLEIAAEMGLPGLLVFLMMYGSTFRMLERIRKRAGPGSLMRTAATAFQTAFVGAGVGAFFISAQFQKFPWFFLFLAMSMPPLAARARRHRRKKPAGDESEVAVQPAQVGVDPPLGATAALHFRGQNT